MKKFGGDIVWVLCVGALLTGFVFAVNQNVMEKQEDRKAVTANLHEEAEKAAEYTQSLLDIIKSLSRENTLMCERDAKTILVVAEFDGENRRLKCSLSEAAERLEKQQEEINTLMDKNTRLNYRVGDLERVLEERQEEINILTTQNIDLNHRVGELEQALEAVEDADTPSPTPAPTPPLLIERSI